MRGVNPIESRVAEEVIRLFYIDQGGAMKKIIIFLFLCLTPWFGVESSLAGGSWFAKETQIKDEYLEKLFIPSVPYEWVKVVEDEKGNRFIVIRLKEKVTKEIMNDYGFLLLSRGVNIYGTYHYGSFSWQTTVTDFAITITRKMEGDRNSVEISESVVLHPEKKEPIVAVAISGEEIRIAIEADLGRRWKGVEIIPEKELDYSDPQIGRYPGAKLRQVMDWGGNRISKYYVSTAPVKNIYEFYYGRVKERFGSIYSITFNNLSEKIENPKFRALPFKAFGIRTICQKFDIRGSKPVAGDKTVRIDLLRSLDINLKDFIEVFIAED